MDFWERVEKYKQLGLDPLKWVAGCAVKVDLTTVVYPALRMIRPDLEKFGVTVSPREDADIFPLLSDGGVERRVYDLRKPQVDPKDLRKINPERAISLVQVHQRKAETPKNFADALLNVYSKIGEADVHFTVGKGHSIMTPYDDAEFALFDFISRRNGQGKGFTLANNDTIQVIDPTDDPGSEAQAYVAISNSMNDLLTLGCFENIRVYPVYDGPYEELIRDIRSHMESFGKRYPVTVHDSEAVGKGKLLIGATIVGDMFKQPPTKYNDLEPGMEIIVSRPFGDLAPINVYLSCLADEEYMKKLEENGISMRDAEKAKNVVVETMKQPNIKIGETINKYLPDYGQPFDKSEHIVCTGDLSGPGIYIFKEIAEIGKADIRLDKIPLAFPEYVQFASAEYLMDNGTAGTNGAVAIIGRSNVVGNVYRDLAKNGYQPQKIGSVVSKGEGKVQVGDEVRRIVSSPSLRREFVMTKLPVA